MTDIIPVGKFEKRIEQVVNHLVGTKLPLSNAMTPVERNNIDFTREVLSKVIRRSPETVWERINVTPKL